MPEELRGPVYPSVSPLRAVEILAFAPVSASELAVALCCHPRTARRLLQRLAGEGWARRTGGRGPRYELTLRAVAMAAQAQRRSPFAQAALGLVGEVAERVERPVYVAIPCYRQLLCVASSAGASARRGDLIEIAGSVPGRVLLAYRRPWREMLITQLELDTPDSFAIKEMQRLGYARVGDEVAVAVGWRGEGVLGALAIADVANGDVEAIASFARSVAAEYDPEPSTRERA